MPPIFASNMRYRFTIPRIWNAFLVLSSFYLSRWIRRPIQWGLPISISVEPTTACNLRCPECPSGLRAFTRDTGNLKQDFFRRIIEDLHRHASFLTFYFQGEPYINPSFLEMVSYAKAKGLYTITSTNAHFLDDDNARKTIESGLDELIISVDGTTQEVYEQYRKEGTLEKVLIGARNVVKWKRKLGSRHPKVVFQFLVVRPNEHQIPEVFKLADEIGADEVRLKTAQIYDYGNGHPLIPENERYSRYLRQSDGTYRTKHKLINQCWRLWHTAVITWDGWVVPCCFDKDAKHKMGSLKESSFKQIWQGPAYRQFRSQILIGRHKIDICANCSEGCKVYEG